MRSVLRWKTRAPLNETFIVADAETVSVAEIIATLRARGRPPCPRSCPCRPRLLALAFGLIGQREKWEQLAGSLVAEPKKLMAAGWRPAGSTPRCGAFAAMVQARLAAEKSGTASRSTP